MNSEDPNNQDKLAEKLSCFPTDKYIEHLGWADSVDNQAICKEFVFYFEWAVNCDMMGMIHPELYHSPFVKLFKAHFELLRKWDKDLSSSEWDKVEARFTFKKYVRRADYKGYRIEFEKIRSPFSGPMLY